MSKRKKRKQPIQVRVAPVPPPSQVRESVVKRVPRSLWSLIVAFSVLIGVWGALPSISITEGDRLDATDPFSQIFIAKNEGYLPIFSPEIGCVMYRKVGWATASDFLVVKFNPNAPYPPFIIHAGTFTASCYAGHLTPDNSPNPIPFSVPGSKLDITITYGFWPTSRPFWRRSQTFHFETRASDGGKTQQWVQEGSG